MRKLLALLLLPLFACAEIIDRIALTIDGKVVTESMLIQQIRLSAFLDNVEPIVSSNAKRSASEVLISRLLLWKEMDDTRYPVPAMSAVREYARESILTRFPSADALRRELTSHSISEEELYEFLQQMVRSLEFIDLRFRRGQQAASDELADYYKKQYAPAWQRANPGKPVPSLEDAADEIEEIILTVKTDQAREEWLKEARSHARIRIRPDAFAGESP
ncbi:MAG: hypothetical protein HYZ37_03570 [Candidatus Solibacter usitatus]|nr:hypothetical protein [Candidatus Solibacter usitatus]